MATESPKVTAEAEIRALIDDLVEAVRAKDVDGIMSHYAPDIVTFDLAPPLISSTANAEGLEAWFATWRDPIGYEVRDLKVTASDDVAFSHALNRLSGTNIDGEKADIWFRQTLCFRKIRNDWRIAHQHESVPFYMDGSYRAAVDLKP